MNYSFTAGDYLTFAILAISLVFLAWQLFSKKGKALRAKNIALQSERTEALRNANLNYPSRNGLIGYFAVVGGLFAAIGYMVGMAFFSYADLLWVFFVIMGFAMGAIVFGLSHAVASQAVLKGRKYDQFFLLSVLISPLICFLIVASMSSPNSVAESVKTNKPNMDSDLGVAEKIEALSQMKEKGLISEAEFLAKKADLLSKF